MKKERAGVGPVAWVRIENQRVNQGRASGKPLQRWRSGWAHQWGGAETATKGILKEDCPLFQQGLLDIPCTKYTSYPVFW